VESHELVPVSKFTKSGGGIDLTGPATKGVAGIITKLVLWPDAEQVSAAEFAENLGLPEGTEAWVEKHSTEYPPGVIMVEGRAVFEKRNWDLWLDWQKSEAGKMAAVLVTDLDPSTDGSAQNFFGPGGIGSEAAQKESEAQEDARFWGILKTTGLVPATLHQTLVTEDGTKPVTEIPMEERPWLWDIYEKADPVILAKSPTKQRAEEKEHLVHLFKEVESWPLPFSQANFEAVRAAGGMPNRFVNEILGEPTPIEPSDICTCLHAADQHKWLNDPAPLRSRHLRCTMCDCGHFKERDAP